VKEEPIKIGDRFQSPSGNIWIAAMKDDVDARFWWLDLEGIRADQKRASASWILKVCTRLPPIELSSPPAPPAPPPPEPTREQVDRDLADREHAQMRRLAYEQDRDPERAILSQMQAPLAHGQTFLLRGR
jgi:hypothetical protein